MADVYVTIGLDKAGNVVEVRLRGGDPIQPKESKAGPMREGGEAPGCEQIVKTLQHELLLCRKKKTPPDTPPVTDPCCYRDPATGRVWCWC